MDRDVSDRRFDRVRGVVPRKVKFTITGRSEGTDAPSVEDMLDHLRDFIDILKGVEEAASGAPASAIVWRVVDARRSSPLAIEIQAFAREFATNIDQRSMIVVTGTARGLASLQHRAERPKYFTDLVMRKAQRTFSRVTNGIERSAVDFGADLPRLDITATAGRNAARNVELALARPDRPYKEVGSAEGSLESVEVDGFGRRVIHIRERITGQSIKCFVDPAAAGSIERLEVNDIWRCQRVMVSGIIHYHGVGDIEHIVADDVRVIRPRGGLPQFADITDADFTGGRSSMEYLDLLRDGTLS